MRSMSALWAASPGLMAFLMRGGPLVEPEFGLASSLIRSVAGITVRGEDGLDVAAVIDGWSAGGSAAAVPAGHEQETQNR